MCSNIGLKLPNGLALFNTYSGSEINQHYRGTKFYKFLEEDITKYYVDYKIGLNVQPMPFDSNESGVFCFYDETKCHLHFAEYKTKLAFIEIPDDANVYIHGDKYSCTDKYDEFCSDKIIITKIMDFNDVDDEFWLSIIPKNSYALKYVKNQTEEICRFAVQQKSHVLKREKSESQPVYDCWGTALKYVAPQYVTYDICLLAVQKEASALEFVPEQFKSEEICTLAVKQTGYTLRYVKNPSEELCKLAVQKDGYALKYVPENFQTEELCILAFESGYGGRFAFRFVINQTENLCKHAVQINCEMLEYVKERFQTEELCKLAIQQNCDTIKYVKNPSEEIKQFATQQKLYLDEFNRMWLMAQRHYRPNVVDNDVDNDIDSDDLPELVPAFDPEEKH